MSGVITNYNYIEKETEQKIKQFKYKGGSVSILYGYIWSPLCQWLVEQLPNTIAPNLITVSAFSFTLLSHILLVYHSPDFSQQVPSYLLFFTGITTLAYQILDNMDGKQARRTGSSTPLGMLVDHFLDSVNSWIFGINQIICFGAGQSPLVLFTLLVSCYLGFYAGMWSQYHIGELKLGKINAVDEGLVLVWNLFFLTSIVGQQFWQQEVYYGYQLGEIVCIGLLSIALGQIANFVYMTLKTETHETVYQKLKTQEQSVILLLTFAVVGLYSPTQILSTPYLYWFLVSIGMIWSKSTLHIQIAHLGDVQNFNQWRKSFIAICFTFIVNTLSAYYTQDGQTFIDEKKLIMTSFVASLCIFVHTTTNVAHQLSKLLEIQIFSLKYQQKQKAKVQ